MEKKCPKCNEVKIFHKNKARKGGLQAYCVECNGNGKSRRYAKYRKDKCEKCSFVPEHMCQLDVDHIDGNRNNNDPRNLMTLCANCHRLKTYLERLKKRVRQEIDSCQVS